MSVTRDKMAQNGPQVDGNVRLIRSVRRRFSGDFSGADREVMELVEERDLMLLSLRGTRFEVNLNAVRGDTVSTLTALAARWRESGHRKPLYVDRNPDILHCILDYQAGGELHLPAGVCGEQLRRELTFWGLGLEVISPCCLSKLTEDQRKSARIQAMLSAWEHRQRLIEGATGLCTRIWHAYIFPFTSNAGKVGYGFVALLYAIFLALLTMSTMTQFRESIDADPYGNATYRTYPEYVTATVPVYWLRLGDLVLLTIFTAGVAFLFAICPDRRKHWCTCFNLVVVVALLAQWVPVTFTLLYGSGHLAAWPHGLRVAINTSKVTRIIPALLMLSHFRSIQVMWQALASARSELLLLVILVFISSGVFGFLVYMAEVTVVGSQFRSVPDGVWWGLVTLTTVGYGDFYPHGLLGKLTGGCCAVAGILVVGLPVPIIAGNYTMIYDMVETAERHLALVTAAAADRRGATGPGGTRVTQAARRGSARGRDGGVALVQGRAREGEGGLSESREPSTESTVI